MKLNVYDTSDKQTSLKEPNSENGVTEDMGPSITGKENSLLRFMGTNSYQIHYKMLLMIGVKQNYTLLQKSKVATLFNEGSLKRNLKS
jgi:hypothetical protein